MGRREKERKNPKSDFEDGDDAYQNAPHDASFAASDSDDEEANEDLSLKIVEKARSRASDAAAPAAAADDGVLAGTSNDSAGEDIVTTELVASKVLKKKVKKEKKKKAKKADFEIQEVTLSKEGDVVGNTKDEEEAKISETDAVDNSNSDNVVLRRLLRGPRYFDPPDKSWGACFNCGEEGHSAANCKSARRKKPCFVCGSLDHEVKQCQKGQDCFICKGGGHRAKDCPKKFKRCSQGSELCLKCGAAGHAMYSCNNDYSPNDLKEIQCYVCKRFGHLCCADYSDALASEASCYKCGQSGHNGQECRGSRTEASAGTPSSCFKCGEEGHFSRECTSSARASCFKCGEEGHFARECTNSAKAKKRTRDLSTPTGKRPKDNKGNKGMKSAPKDLGKGHTKKKLTFEDGSSNWSGKSKRRGGWITDDPEDFPRKNVWRSPATPNKHMIYNLNDSGQGSTSHFSKKRSKFSSVTPNSQGYAKSYQHRYSSASRFGYSNGDGMRRNYDWW